MAQTVHIIDYQEKREMNLMGRIFGTDGARGVANTEISCTLAMDIGRAAAMVVARDHHKRKPVFLVGHDTRISHDMLESAIAAGLCSVGADVVTLGTVPTPAVAYLVANSDADAAIMLSASHNPYEFNGIKIFGAEGFKLTDEEEMEIEEIVLDHVLPYDLKWNDELGVIRSGETLVEQYIDHIVSTVEGDLSGIRVAADCANGSASATAAKIFAKLGADVTILNDKPNGVNINDNCGSTHIDMLGKYVRENGFDLGVAFDGDADRCLAVDENGELVDGDKLIAIFSSQMKREGKLANDTAVVTVMSNMGFFKFAEQAGIHVEKTSVGDRYVLQNMLEHGHCIGGEQSGHIIFREFMTTGDGQLTAVQLLRAIKKSGKKLSELAQLMQVYPQVILNVRADKEMKRMVKVDEGVLKRQQQLEEGMNGNGRILVRPSGTEPVIRIMVEGLDREAIMNAAKSMEQIIIERLGYNEDCKGLERI